MKNVTFKMLMMACFLLVASYANAQFKQGDKSTIGQTWTTDAETGKCVLTTTFNPDKDPSSYTMDADTALISLAKCTTNKGMQIEVRDTAGNKVYNGDFKCKSYRSYDNPVFVAGTDALVDILNMYENNEAVGKTTGNTTSDSIPAHCIFKVGEGGTNGDGAFGAWPGQWKDVKYDFYYRPKGFSLTEDITFDVMTVYEGSANLGGATASYNLVLKAGSFQDTLENFYVSGDAMKTVNLAGDFGQDPAILSGQDIYITVYTAGTGTEVAIDKFDPVIGFDNMVMKLEATVWIDPAAGLEGSSTWSNEDAPAESAFDVDEATYSLHLQTLGRSGAFSIVDDLQGSKTVKHVDFAATGAIKGNDGAGNYTVDIPYTLTAAVQDPVTFVWTKAKVEIAAPLTGKVNDDFMLSFTASPTFATKVNRFELDPGTRIWYDFNFKKEQKKVAYITAEKDMDAMATMPSEDPIIQMLDADEMIDLNVMVVASDSALGDLSMYDAVVVQEGFGSGSAILKPGASLALDSIPVPFVYNKMYGLRSGKGLTSGTGASKESANPAYKVEAANQTNDLFKGITFAADSFIVLRNTYNDLGAAGTKALNYNIGNVISEANTLLASPSGITDAVFGINDLPAGTVIDSETTKSRMIAIGMNFGAISAAKGTNLTSEGLTLWRNMVYSLVGLDIPAEMVIAPKPMAVKKHSYTFEGADAAADVVGDADGTLMGGVVKNGVYIASADGEYISLPADQIAINTYPAISVELYITANGVDVGGNVMTSYFGNTNADNTFGTDYFFTSHKSRAAISCLNTAAPWGAEQGVSGTALLDGEKHHLVSTLSDEMISWYVDGVLIGTAALSADNKIANISNAFAYLCKSGYNGDKTWQGTIHEYSIYEGELKAEEIAENAANWPVEVKTNAMVAYVTAQKDMDASATMVAEDPIIKMLEADANIELTVMVVAADSVLGDLSMYDAVVVQEGFGSGSEILKPGKSLGLEEIPVPFIYNKMYGLRSGKALTSGDGASKESSNLSYMVDAANQGNDLFKAITFAADTFMVFHNTYNDAGAAGTKSLNYNIGNAVSGDNTLLGVPKGATDVVFGINDVPAGTVIDSDTLQTRMIAVGMNFGAISADMGYNFTNAGLTFWRNAVYSLGGLVVPNTEVIAPTHPNKVVAFVTKSPLDKDSVVVDAILAHGGYDVVLIDAGAKGIITADNLEALNAANVVIMGRNIGSSDVGTAQTVWDDVTAPVLSMNMWGLRGLSGKAWWTTNAVASNVTSNPDTVLTANILVADDAVFEGLTSASIDWWEGMFSVFGPDENNDNAGNGVMLATTTDNSPLFIRWAANKEFYPGAGHSPKGDRTYLGNGNDDTELNYFGFSDASEVVFFNELARMASGEALDYGDVAVADVKVANGLTVYPNPARDFATLRIEMVNSALANLTIYNMVGQMSEVSLSQQLNAGVNEISINTQSLKRGMYIFVLKAGGQSYQGKINIVK